MAWCPVCRNEYREGITECADCHVSLVEELPEETLEEKPFLEISVGEELQEAADALAPEEDADEHKRAKVYRSNQERAEEFSSSAWTLVIVGFIGLVAMILIMTGVLPLHFAANVRYLSYGVMTLLFLAFIVIGIRSFGSAKTYAQAAEVETALTEEIHAWFMEAFTKESIDAGSFLEDEQELSDIEKYYRRNENIKQKITAKYTELDDAYLNQIADDFFHEIYE